MVIAIAGAAILRQDQEAAVGYMVARQTLLRTGELLQLRVMDIVFADALRSAVLNLGLTKGGARRGTEESVILDDPQVTMLLAAVVAEEFKLAHLSQQREQEPSESSTPPARHTLYYTRLNYLI